MSNLLLEFLRNPRDTGTLFPDSKFIAKAILNSIDFSEARCIVEWGGGSGTITEKIVNRKKEGTIFLVIEKNPRLHAILKRKFHSPESLVYVIHGDAMDTPSILSSICGEAVADYIISTIPASNMNFGQLCMIARSNIRKAYIQYFHILSFLKLFFPEKELKKTFGRFERKLVWLNIPPAVIYISYVNGHFMNCDLLNK